MATNAAPEPVGGSPAPSANDHVEPRISAELARLRAAVGERVVTLGEIVDVLGLRAHLVLMVLLALPFITPVPLPFISTPCGLAIGGVALRIALGRPPGVSAKLRAKVLPRGFIGRLLGVAGWLIRLLEKRMRPRLDALIATGPLLRLHATMMVIAAGVLLLPLFVPLTNAFPALTILLISAGLLERDGLAVLAGYAAFALGALYFFLLGEGATEAVEWLMRRF